MYVWYSANASFQPICSYTDEEWWSIYGLGKWNDAEMEYRKAKEEESTLKSDFNLGNIDAPR